MNVKIFLVATAMACCVSAAHADIYRCTGSDGKTVYQPLPCTTGTQKALDDSEARARQRAEMEKKEAEARNREAAERYWEAEADRAKWAAKRKENEEKELKQNLAQLRTCLRGRSCSSHDYVRLLRGKNTEFVRTTLGEPELVQIIGGETLEYFTVPTSDGRHQAQLQVIYKNSVIKSVNAY